MSHFHLNHFGVSGLCGTRKQLHQYQDGNSLSSQSSREPVDWVDRVLTHWETGQLRISNYFSTLRTRAALTLTANLTPSERDKLLKSIQVHDKTPENDVRSVGEAVVKALAEEAIKGKSSSSETHQQEILARAEQAAFARVEHEIQIQKSRNGKILNDLNSESEHPILGKPLVDLGYKRIHLMSASRLSSIPVWEKQRTYRHNRAKLMAADKLKTQNTGLPGIITLFESQEDGRLSILDGQHRVGMLTLLNEKTDSLSLDLQRILVEVFVESSDRNAEDLFLEINKAEPVKLVDLPGAAKSSERKIINEAASTLASQFAPMFKASQRCRPPHLNIDNLRDALFTAGVLEKQPHIRSSKALLTWMLEKNLEWKDKYTNSEQDSNINKKVLLKAIEHDFFLGMDSGWLFQ